MNNFITLIIGGCFLLNLINLRAEDYYKNIVESSGLVFHGKVKGVSHQDDKDGQVYALVEIEVKELLKFDWSKFASNNDYDYEDYLQLKKSVSFEVELKSYTYVNHRTLVSTDEEYIFFLDISSTHHVETSNSVFPFCHVGSFKKLRGLVKGVSLDCPLELRKPKVDVWERGHSSNK